MTTTAKILERILGAQSDANVPFRDLVTLLHALGFDRRTRGNHHIFTRPGVVEILNLQSRGSLAKAYQVRQVRNVIFKYRLGSDLATEV